MIYYIIYLLEIKLFLFLAELPHSDLNSHLEGEESENMSDPKPCTKKHHDTEEKRGWCLLDSSLVILKTIMMSAPGGSLF